ncbi:hypothetical protein HanIR_Chr02g0085161 [Helianthus annuus]|nr:hypothetical protein HanIR_Chr02g0085161 [Helianthus annuus]
MGKQRISDIYYQLDSSSKDKETSFQPNPSEYSADIEKGNLFERHNLRNHLPLRREVELLEKVKRK